MKCAAVPARLSVCIQAHISERIDVSLGSDSRYFLCPSTAQTVCFGFHSKSLAFQLSIPFSHALYETVFFTALEEKFSNPQLMFKLRFNGTQLRWKIQSLTYCSIISEYRLDDFYVLLSNTKPVIGQDLVNVTLCTRHQGRIPAGASALMMCPVTSQLYRYVIIQQLRDNDYLFLAEVEVYTGNVTVVFQTLLQPVAQNKGFFDWLSCI